MPPPPVSEYPDCNGPTGWIGDGYCDAGKQYTTAQPHRMNFLEFCKRKAVNQYTSSDTMTCVYNGLVSTTKNARSAATAPPRFPTRCKPMTPSTVVVAAYTGHVCTQGGAMLSKYFTVLTPRRFHRQCRQRSHDACCIGSLTIGQV